MGDGFIECHGGCDDGSTGGHSGNDDGFPDGSGNNGDGFTDGYDGNVAKNYSNNYYFYKSHCCNFDDY